MTPLPPLSRTQFLAGFIAHFRERKLDYQADLQRFKLPGDPGYHNYLGLLPTARINQFLNHMALQHDWPSLGHDVADFNHLDELGVLGQLLMAQDTLQQAIETLCEQLNLFSSGVSFWLSIPDQGRYAWLCRSGFSERWMPDCQVQLEMYALCCQLLVVRHATGENWQPDYLKIRSEQSWILEQTESFQRSQISGGHTFTAMAINKKELGLTMPGESCAPQMPIPAASWQELMENLIVSYLQDPVLSLDTLASCLEIGPRTLQRRLQAEDLSFRGLVQGARMRLACNLLTEEQESIAVIASRLGYQNPTHFSRSFKSYFGDTPKAFREQKTA